MPPLLPTVRRRPVESVRRAARSYRGASCRPSRSAVLQATLREHPSNGQADRMMRWLVRLLTPKGGLVLDPFTGSGSTGAAAVLEGAHFLGIEREAEYVPIRERRSPTGHAKRPRAAPSAKQPGAAATRPRAPAAARRRGGSGSCASRNRSLSRRSSPRGCCRSRSTPSNARSCPTSEWCGSASSAVRRRRLGRLGRGALGGPADLRIAPACLRNDARQGAAQWLASAATWRYG